MLAVGCGDSSASNVGGKRPLVLLASGDTAGWIAPCGCTSNQSGGLARRGTYVAQARKEAAVLMVDVGGAAAGTSAYDRAKFEAILKGELAMGVYAHNLGAVEVRLGAAYLRELAERLKIPFVSCNVRDADGKPITKPLVETRAGGRTIELTGVLSERFATPETRVAPPLRAILDEVGESSKRQPNALVVVLAYVPADELRELAAALPEVDLIIGGPTGQSVLPEKIGPVTIASATNKGKFLARFDWPAVTADAGTPSRAVSGRMIEMSHTLADDPKQRDNLQRFYAELGRRDFAPGDTSFAPRLPRDLPAGYALAGSESCRRCHQADCKAWDASKHAATWTTLTAKGSHVDSYCQQCHTTGYGLPGGFRSPTRTPKLVAVGCENCHGPSAAHVLDPPLHTPQYATASGSCKICHDQENSPAFAYDAYWPKIKHGQMISDKR